MKHGDAVAEVGAEAGHGLGRERDLRHEHDGRSGARVDDLLEELDIDQGLSGGGDAVEQDGLRRGGVQSGHEPSQRGRLGGIGRQVGRRLLYRPRRTGRARPPGRGARRCPSAPEPSPRPARCPGRAARRAPSTRRRAPETRRRPSGAARARKRRPARRATPASARCGRLSGCAPSSPAPGPSHSAWRGAPRAGRAPAERCSTRPSSGRGRGAPAGATAPPRGSWRCGAGAACRTRGVPDRPPIRPASPCGRARARGCPARAEARQQPARR